MAANELRTFVDHDVHLASGNTDDRCSAILCGDFNTPPTFPAYRMMDTGSIDAKLLKTFVDEKGFVDEVRN